MLKIPNHWESHALLTFNLLLILLLGGGLWLRSSSPPAKVEGPEPQWSFPEPGLAEDMPLPEERQEYPPADPQKGAHSFRKWGCDHCHTPSTRSRSGSDLRRFFRRPRRPRRRGRKRTRSLSQEEHFYQAGQHQGLGLSLPKGAKEEILEFQRVPFLEFREMAAWLRTEPQ